MKTLTTTIKISYTNEGNSIDIKTEGVPQSLIVEVLQNISASMATSLIEEAEEVVGDGEEAKQRYLNGRISVDRKKLHNLLNA